MGGSGTGLLGLAGRLDFKGRNVDDFTGIGLGSMVSKAGGGGDEDLLEAAVEAGSELGGQGEVDVGRTGRC